MSDEEGSRSGSESGDEGGGMDMNDMFAGMMCAETSDGEGGAEEEEGGGGRSGEEEEEGGMNEEDMRNTDLGTLMQEFEIDFKHFNALSQSGGGYSYAHVARGGDRGLTKSGIPTLKARKIWKTAVTRAKEKEAKAAE
jgi:hypothetical protein